MSVEWEWSVAHLDIGFSATFVRNEANPNSSSLATQEDDDSLADEKIEGRRLSEGLSPIAKSMIRQSREKQHSTVRHLINTLLWSNIPLSPGFA